MSIFRSRPAVAEARSLTMPAVWHVARESFGTVDPASGETALQSVAVRSTVDLICSLVSELPVEAYRGVGDAKRAAKVPGNVLDPGGDGAGVEDWTYRLLTSWLMRGNGYGREIAWDAKTGAARQVDLLHPDDVTARLTDGKPSWWFVDGQQLDASTFAFWRVNPMPGRLLGLSQIAMHATTIGVSLRSARFGDQWFSDGAHPSGILTTEANVTTDQLKEAKRLFMASQKGRREPLALGMGWSYKTIQVSPEESQFLETQGFSEAQCARMFGPGFAEILGYESGGSMTYANVTDRDLFLLKYSVNRWVRRVERVLTRLTPEPVRIRFNRDALLQATTLQRYQAHDLGLKWRTVNEVRAIEDLPPVVWGDDRPDVKGAVTSADSAKS